LIAGCVAQLVGQRRVERHIVEQPDILSRCGELRLDAVAVTLRIDPVPREIETHARPDVGGIAETKPEGAWLSRGQLYSHRYALLLGVDGIGIDPDAVEVAAGLHRLV